jgi:hypothetical protein
MYFLRYEVGQQYKPHHDYFSDEVYIRDAGNRIATVVMYLGEPEEGGETVFPMAGLTVPVRQVQRFSFIIYIHETHTHTKHTH